MMTKRRRAGRGSWVLTAAGIALASAGGCASGRGGKALHVYAPATVVLDGAMDEWPTDAACVADEDYIYFRLSLQGAEPTLQSSSEPISIWLDLDDNPGTGRRMGEVEEAATYGIDLEVTFSPRPEGGGAGRGASAAALAADGMRTDLKHGQVGLAFAPTHAAEWFEGRISRHAEGLPPGVAEALAASGRASGIIVLYDDEGHVAGWSDPFSFRKPARYETAPLSINGFPPRDPGTLRVMSWNVLKGAPAKAHAPFDRVIQALQPDVILFQEWPDASAGEIAGWFTALIPSATPWQVRVAPGTGVAIVSRFEIAPLGPEVLERSEGSAEPPVRWVGGIVQTPLGDAAVASVHLKCCGFKGSPEDVRRMEEAGAINSTMLAAMGDCGPLRVIAGDLNLVGSRPPLDILRAGLDADGSELAVAQPFVVGDAAQYTWFDPGNEFSAGRLDYVVYGDAGAELVRAFVLDTRRLNDAALARLGLDRGDSAASDHMPVVIDLRLR